VELQGDAREAEYRRTCDQLFSTYAACLDPVREVVRSRVPRKDGETEARWDGRIRSRYVDVCRFLLPASALANVGMTANARTLEHAIRKMLSHPLEEVRAIGAAVKQAALVEVPTLVKYAERVPYWEEAERRLEEWSAAHIDPSPNPRGAPRRSSRGAPFRGGETERHSAAPFVELLDYDREGEEKVLAAATYRHGTLPAREALERIRGLQAHERAELIGAVLGGLEQHDVPLRVLEHSQYTFDLLMDQGAYLEMKRHRMMTQSPQRLTADLGYSLPRLIREAGQEAEYRRAMEAAEATYRSLAAWNPDVAAYVVPNAFRRRLLISLNLREAYHFCELRSAANAHFSIRRIALRMAELIREVHPGLAAFMRLPAGADWRKIEEENFAEV
jgi:thymidylate synthase ThyX